MKGMKSKDEGGSDAGEEGKRQKVKGKRKAETIFNKKIGFP